ncbi:prepilin-type N-terminal cleavage/methylation domain-containing protein [Candidatus Sumerlaeota bacterium]|nr:prepilin-type N-terminal cleavage/methylation domain-containing protein [Candidatus Sumerlaeota bacterium]
MKQRAFTLIELLIVVAIIAILAAIAVPNFLEAQVRAKVTRCKADMRTLGVALETYRVDWEQYPPDENTGQRPSVGPDLCEILCYKRLTTPVAYITTLPTDPFFMAEGRIPTGTGWTARNIALYEYSEENYQDGVNAANAANARVSGVGFIMNGVGPDRYRDFQWQPPEWLAVGRGDGSFLSRQGRAIGYDPTNGTVSSGDILYTTT